MSGTNERSETITIYLYRQGPIKFVIESGKRPQVIWPEDLNLLHMAHSLANVNRFTGNTERGFSVAEHSVHLRDIVNEKYGFAPLNRAALLHDLPECLGINDLHTRIKSLLAPEVRELEEVVMWGLWKRFSGTPTFWHEMESFLKPYDRELGNYENNALFTPGYAMETSVLNLKHGNPEMLSAEEALALWKQRWNEDNKYCSLTP